MISIECILSWICLLAGVSSGDSLLVIASGVFAVAANIIKLGNRRGSDEG